MTLAAPRWRGVVALNGMIFRMSGLDGAPAAGPD
jgi:hypothetical protein